MSSWKPIDTSVESFRGRGMRENWQLPLHFDSRKAILVEAAEHEKVQDEDDASSTRLRLLEIELANIVALDRHEDEDSQVHHAASSNYDDDQDCSTLDTTSLEQSQGTRSVIVASIIREPAATEERPPDPISSSPSKFDQLLELVKTLNGLVSEQSKALNAQNEDIKAELRAQLNTMNKHSTMLQALETDATKGIDRIHYRAVADAHIDDKAYEGRKLGDAQTWNALDKETLAKIKVMVEEWREVMQISLVFIALFLTVVTAFISPVIQIFTTPSDSSSGSKPPLPTVPTQLVALFYYLALITSISNSVLCVLGMQWGARLIATPLGKTNLERALARERRMLSAEGKMRSLMGVLVWTLLISIGFFVLGFLIQLWDLTFSFAGSAPILVVGGVLATGLSLIILGIIMVTTIHAALIDNSPFESPLSNAMKPFLRWFGRRLQKEDKAHDESKESKSNKDTEDVGALIKWKKDDAPNTLALKTYAKLVLNTNDVEVLERAIPSFEFGEWYAASDSLFPVFHAVRDRFLATDTSFRVKETVHQQVVSTKDWAGWKDQRGEWRNDLKANEFTRWCRDQCYELIVSARGSRRDYFLPFAFFVSLEEDNEDLRRWASKSNKECVAGILCTFDSDGELGDREDIFGSAVMTCKRLLSDGRTDDVTAILSCVDRASVLRSLIRNPGMWWFEIRDLVTFIVKGSEVEILDEMSDFLSNLPEMSAFADSDNPLLVCELLEHIIRRRPSDFSSPHSLDLSPVLELVNQNSLFKRYSKTLIYYLARGGLENLSDLHSALKLWEYCRDVHNDPHTSDEVVSFYENYHYCFIPLPPLSSNECDDLAHNICALMTIPTDDLPNKIFKRPILDLSDLDDQQKQAVVTSILSKIRVPDFVTLLIKESYLPWNRVQDLVMSAAKDHALGILSAMSDSRAFDDLGNHMAAMLNFLGCLIPSLPSDVCVPSSFDLSSVVLNITRRKRDRQAWRKHSETIIFYLDHGAFDQIRSNYLDDAAHLFNICTVDSQKMKKWKDEERTSEHTRQRAMFYREKLKARAAQDPDSALADVLRPYFPEGFDQLPPVVTDEPQLSQEQAAPTSRFQKWRNIFRNTPPNTMLLDNPSDIELGTTRGLDIDEYGA
ncbi:hypothetical protein SISNIDRAFT_528661 [Sistotremastrum niveocremeum HHB9708]|uniref:DUF6535 domain-containing protein n=1 Tax=Sistotremastrum niveocremeum HHB9708 TaxID=1314777 RepID=A0A164PN96_9AGAM|nr:hypothetical protein SISNIDRAFT_528661 [Sistotremastrum niveocremeum HHB9708]